MVYVMTYNTPVGNFLSVWSTRDAAIEEIGILLGWSPPANKSTNIAKPFYHENASESC